MKKEHNSTNSHKRIFNHFNLYKKEQLAICALMLCFVLSFVILPRAKEKLALSEVPEISTSMSSSVEPANKNETTEESTNENNESSSSATPPTTDAADSSTANSGVANTDASGSSTANSDTSDSGAPDSDTANPDAPDSSVTDSDAPDSSVTGSDASAPGTSAPDASAPSEQVWVPPVYKIIHHEAVYETKRIVVCNYCGETFDTVGEFQVHKNAHGG